jgi:hypothetical protein
MPAPAGPRRDVVEIPRRVLIGAGIALVALLVAGLMVVAYRAGRESARAGLPTPAPALSRPEEIAPSTRPPASDAPPAAPGETASLGGVPSMAPPLAERAALAAGAASPLPTATLQAADPAREAVALYLSRVEAIEAQARYWSDPQALAQTLVEQATRGEASGFDKLIETNRAALQQLRGLNVPAECREHYATTIPLMEDAISLLERLRQGLGSDTGSLQDVPALAQDLERRGRQVDTLAADLKRRYRTP